MATEDSVKDLVVAEQGDGSVIVVDPTVPEPDESQGSHEDQAADAALDSAPGLDDDERTAIRERRREERQRKKASQRQHTDELRNALQIRDAEIAELRTSLVAIQHRNTGADLAQLDVSVRKAVEAAEYYKDAIARGTEAKDGKLVAEATQRMIDARGEAQRLSAIKSQFVNTQSATASPMDPAVLRNAQAWHAANPWYDPAGGDPDSKIAKAIDQQLAEEGFNPRSTQYWAEMDARTKKYLPHVAKTGHNAATSLGKPSRIPVAGSSRESSSAGAASGSFNLSPARVQALKDAGLYNDPAKRDKAIRDYRTYDLKQAQQR